jgi:phosphopantetheinyl transferase (holo-ACP synthase)
MEGFTGYTRFVDRISREEFIELFSEKEERSKWYSEKELERFNFPKNARSLAARYIIKRRILEQVGSEGNALGIEILNDEMGKPVIILGHQTQKLLKEKGISEIHCSLSHSRNYIVSLTIFVH